MRLRPILSTLMLAVALSTGSFVMAAETGKIVVATVNLDTACNQIGYDVLPSLSLDAETKSTLLKIRAEKAKLQQDLLKATDEITLRKANESLQFLNSKEQSIRNHLGRNRNGDYRLTLSRFVKEHFGKKYPIIIDANDGNMRNQTIQFDVQEVDITDEVVQEFIKDMDSK